MSYSLTFLKGYIEDYIGEYIGVCKGDARMPCSPPVRIRGFHNQRKASLA